MPRLPDATAHQFSLVLACALALVVPAAALGQNGPEAQPRPAAERIFGGGGSRDWTSEVEQSLIEKEYQASENSQGLQAPNRRHGFRVYFEAAGVRLVDRTAPGSPELLRLRAASIGRGAQRLSVPAGVVSAGSQRRVEIVRPPAFGLLEHFENSASGLRQTLTIARRPPGEGDLEILFEVVTAAVERSADGVALAAPTGRRLQASRLPITDAAGRLLASRLSAAGPSQLRLAVEDAGAVYPLIVELLFAGPPKAFLQGDAEGGQFGISVAAAGDVNGDGYGDVVVGANLYDFGEGNEGAAFVFHGHSWGIASGSGPDNAATWFRGNQTNSNFGVSVAGAGDVNGDGFADIVVGAHGYDAGESNEGGAFVFRGSIDGLGGFDPSTAVIRLQSNQVAAGFGINVAGAGDVNGDGFADLLIGAYQYDSGESNEGAAFVFLGAAAWAGDGNPSTAAAILQGDQASANFGWSVAGAGDVNGDGYGDVVVGAYTYDAGESNEGASFVFHGGAAGVASAGPAGAAATLQGNQIGSSFGFSVGAAGDVNGDGYADVVVGAYLYDSGHTDEGAAFLFAGGAAGVSSGGPSFAAATLQGDQTFAQLGYCVAGAGDVNGDGYADVIVGAYRYDAGQADEGAAFVFLGGAAGVASSGVASAAATLQGDQAGAEFGLTVAGAGDVNGDGYADVVVGADLWDAGEINEGAVFSFHGGGIGIESGGPADAATGLRGDQVHTSFGYSVAGAGDVNGDGYSDLIVGAPGYVFADAGDGGAFVYQGSAAGITATAPAGAAATLRGSPGAHSGFAVSVAGAGDVNGDGYADVVVGAQSYDGGETDEGAVFLFLGSAAGIPSGEMTSAAATLQGNQAGARFGISVAGAGDVNGDGYADLLPGAYLYHQGQTNEGAVFLFLGGASGIASGGVGAAAATLQGNLTEAWFGASVASAGDVNGDGFADVVVGAPNWRPVSLIEGAAFVFLGSAAGIPSGGAASAAWTASSGQGFAGFGGSVSGAGDVNGDGYSDVLVGAPRYTLGESLEGAVFVYRGGAGGVAANPASTLQGDQAGSLFGISVAGAGDVNGDGYSDVLVGATDYDLDQNDGGAAFLFVGGPDGIASAGAGGAAAVLRSDQSGAFAGTDFGNSVAGAGDVNGDGFADILVAAYLYNTTVDNAGAAFLFLGNGATGRPVLARQFRAGTTTPVQPWGGSLAGNRFDARMSTYHPAGGGRVKLQVEACPAGLDFGAGGCITRVSPSWANVSATNGLAVTEAITGLVGARLYQWRARTLYAPFSITQSGITPPPNPSHGPWRRFTAQAVAADIRTLGSGLSFFTISPCRLVDTRPLSGAPVGGPILSSGFARTLTLAGHCSIPATARSLSANLTVIAPTGPGQLSFYPVANEPTTATSLSFNGGANRANNAMLGLNPVGEIQVVAFVSNPAGADQVHLAVDVNGYFE